MKHTRKENIKSLNDKIAISVIKNLIIEDKFPEAIKTAEKRGFTAEQFGKIANMTDLSAEEIYKRVFLK